MGAEVADAGPAELDRRAGVVLRVSNVGKTFPGTRALDGVSFEVRRGEIHALIGNNGSGKSTLIKILAGVTAADPGGEITIAGKVFDAHRLTPAKVRAAGMHFVHQVPSVFSVLTVAENLAIGRGFVTGAASRIRWTDQRERASKILERFHIAAEPDQPVAALKPADRTLVAIARALQDQEGEREGVLFLDEPTASLPGPEVDRLLETLRRYAALGQTIVYVTHRLEEVLSTSHRVSALRDGRHAGTVETKIMDESKLVAFMLGRPGVPLQATGSLGAGAEPLLSARHLTGGGVASATFDLERGAIVGIAGLVGSGASELLRMLFGDRPVASGSLTLGGRPHRPTTPRAAMAAGIAYVPADRALEAGFQSMTVRANLSAAGVARYFRRLRLRHGEERADARASIEQFGIRVASDTQPFSTLSGGNQQKVILARWLRRHPKLFLLDEPTQGVDVHAQSEIHRLLRNAAREGTTIVVVSSDFQELARLCDRVLVMVQGRIVSQVSPPELGAHRLTELAHFAVEVPS